MARKLEELVDNMLVYHMNLAMTDKLKKKREEGRHGWYSDEVISDDQLEAEIKDHVVAKDWLDVAIFASMLYLRGIYMNFWSQNNNDTEDD